MAGKGRPIADLTGKRFGRLIVVGIGEKDKHGKLHWICKCECGVEKSIAGSSLRRDLATSCGCYRNEKTVERSRSVNTIIDNGDYLEVIDSKGNSFLIDAEDRQLLQRYWFVIESKSTVGTPTSYVASGDRERELLHRVIMKANGSELVDHIDGNTMNNRRSNLRITSRQVNASNKNVQKNNKSTGILGVHKRGNKYRVVICTKGKKTERICDSLDEAIEVRKQLELEQRGELSHFWKDDKY